MGKRFDRANLVQNLPDAYRKTETSNNAKILAIEKSVSNTLADSILAIDGSLDLAQATGKTLDLYGEMVGQLRGKATDEQYRTMIRARIVRNIANGDYNSIIRAICDIFDCSPTETYIQENDAPCTVSLIGVPYRALDASGIGVENAVKLIRQLLPVGVRLEVLFLHGTFEFGTTDDGYDKNAGFGSADQTVGGYFGMITVGESADLPV